MLSSQSSPNRRRRGGFTLAEALLAATVLAIVSATATLPFAAGVQQTNEAAELDQAVALGQAMMEEVLARPYAAPDGYTSGATRETFQEVADFNGLAETNGDLRDFQNAKITDGTVSGFWRTVTVTPVTFANQATGDAGNLVRVEVRVYRDNALLVLLSRVTTREE